VAPCSLIGVSGVSFREMALDRADLPAYRYAQTIRETPGASFLDMGGLDGGIYTAADIIPSNKYFCKLNIRIEEAKQEWARMIEGGTVDYIYSGRQVLEGAEKYELAQTIDGTLLYRLRAGAGQVAGRQSEVVPPRD